MRSKFFNIKNLQRTNMTSKTTQSIIVKTPKQSLPAQSPNRYLDDNETGQISWMPFILLGIVLSGIVAIAINYITVSPELLIIGGALGLILALVILQRAEFGTYLIIFAVFTNLSDLFTEKGLPSINKPFVAIILASIFINYILKTGKLSPSPKFTRIELALLVYCLVIFASSYVAVNSGNSLDSFLDLAKDIAIGFCVYVTLNSKVKWQNGAYVLILAVTFISFLGAIHTLTGSDNTFWGFAQQSAFGQTSDSGELRYGGPIGESNIWGQVLVSIIPFVLYRIVKSSTFTGKAVFLSSMLLILLSMLFTQSRGAFLALVVVLGFIAYDMKIKGPTLLWVTIAGLAFLLFVPSKYTERLRTLDIFFKADQEYGLSQDESVQGRKEKMLTGLAMFTANPFIGVGFANYSDNYWSYAGSLGLESSARNIDSEDGARQPHSLYIEIMAETGLFGILSFLGFFGLIFQNLFRIRKKYIKKNQMADKDWSAWIISTAMSILTFLIAGFFLHGIGFRFIWVLAGMALALINISNNDNPSKFINRFTA